MYISSYSKEGTNESKPLIPGNIRDAIDRYYFGRMHATGTDSHPHPDAYVHTHFVTNTHVFSHFHSYFQSHTHRNFCPGTGTRAVESSEINQRNRHGNHHVCLPARPWHRDSHH